MAVSEADKIRKAEEIYYKRRYNQNYRSCDEKKKKKSFFKWLIGKIIYIALIVLCVYAYNNKEYLLSDQFKIDLENFFETPINMKEIIEKLYTDNEENVDNNLVIEEIIVENESSDNNDENMSSKEDSENDENIVNSEDLEILNESNVSLLKTLHITYNEESSLSVEEYIKMICLFTKPLSGTITSKFGYRESSYSNVSSNHTGIDIAASYGSDIVSAISGSVVEVSSTGNYGKHLKIASDIDENIITLYAHCSKITVKEGDSVSIGDKIAEVGNTRKCNRNSFTL